jgi:predicted Fe-Mo cluster-binding NifX family protein
MRIAISSDDKLGLQGQVSHHFGRCAYYTIIDLEGEDINHIQVIENPFARNHAPGSVPEFIKEQGVDVMVSGGMGRRAIAFFEQYAVEVATGAEGSIEEALEKYLAGELGGAAPCRESVEHSHGKGHHHHEHDNKDC